MKTWVFRSKILDIYKVGRHNLFVFKDRQPPLQPSEPLVKVRKTATVRKGRVHFSKRVSRQIEAAKTICASIAHLKGVASGGFGERFAAELRAGEAMPDHTLALDLVGRSVRSAAQVLDDAEEAYTSGSSRRVRARKESERIARRELNPEMVAVRRVIDAHYGKEMGSLIHGLEGKTLRKPRRVLVQAGVMVGALKTEAPVAKIGVPVTDLDAWKRRVEPAYERLLAKVEELESLERDEDYLRGARDLAFDQFVIAYGDALTYIQAFYRLVGVSPRMSRCLRPDVDRRRLLREAGQEREARARGRRRPAARPIRSAVSTTARWLRRLQSRIA